MNLGREQSALSFDHEVVEVNVSISMVMIVSPRPLDGIRT